MDKLEEITLREINGRMHRVIAQLAAVLHASLGHLLQSQPVFFYELVMSCRNPSHRLFGTAAGEELKRRALIERLNPDGTAEIHDDIRNIVLASTDGEGLDMCLLPFSDITNNGWRKRTVGPDPRFPKQQTT